MNPRLRILFILLPALMPALISAERIEYIAKKIVYDNSAKTILLCDSISITSPSFSLDGDTILISKKNEMLFGKGRIRLKMNDLDVSGDSVAFDYGEKKGSIFNGKTKIDKGYLRGKKITTLGGSEYYIRDGTFTTCSESIPHYSFYASRMHLYQNDRVIVRPFVMFVKNVPVMAVPFFVLPVATTRKSGFLMPKAGYSSADGKYLKDVSYFYATNDFADMTFSFDVYELRGLSGRYELNVLVNPLLSLLLNAEYISEFSGRKRWSVNGSYSHLIPGDVSLKSRWDIVSDVATAADYSDTASVVLKRNAESFLSLSRDFSGYSGSFAVSRNQNFANKSVMMKLPSYSGFLRKINFAKVKYLIPSGINYSHSHSFENSFYSDSAEEKKNVSTSLNNRFDSSYRLLKYVNLIPAATLNHSLNTLSGVSSVASLISVSANTQIYGVSLFGFMSYQKFRHTLIPDVSFSLGRRWYDTLSYAGIGDSVADEKRMSLSLSNIFEGKTGERKEVLLRSTLTSRYDFLTDSFSAVSAGFQLMPERALNFSLQGSVSPYTGEYKASYTLAAKGEIPNPLSDEKMSLAISNASEFSDTARFSDRLNGSLGMKIGENLKLSASLLYDLLGRELVSSSFSMDRTLHCWKASFRVSTYASSMKYDFSLSLVDIPEVSLNKGIFGPLLP